MLGELSLPPIIKRHSFETFFANFEPGTRCNRDINGTGTVWHWDTTGLLRNGTWTSMGLLHNGTGTSVGLVHTGIGTSMGLLHNGTGTSVGPVHDVTGTSIAWYTVGEEGYQWNWYTMGLGHNGPRTQ